MTAEQAFSRVLVTGCGGDIGQSIGRLLRTLPAVSFVAGCDIHADHAGAAYFDACAVVPRADAADYPETIAAFVQTHAIDLVVPTSEAETRAQLLAQLGEELADVITDLFLLASAAGIDLEAQARAKFNAVSERHGFPQRL